MADPERVRAIYNRRAHEYAGRRRESVDEMRMRLLARARGDVLELGVGTGATFRFYPSDLASLTGVDVSEGMLAEAEPRAAGLPFPVTLRRLDFQTLPFDNAAFDTVTSSLALCGTPDPLGVFLEIRRVLRPGGQLLALEHIRPPNPVLGLGADLVNPVYRHYAGCDLNRRTPELLARTGFAVTVIERRTRGILVALVATPRSPDPDRT